MATTHITGSIYDAAGNKISTGVIRMTLQQDMVTADGLKIAPVTVVADLAASSGTIDVYLHPTVGSSPAGLSYFVEYDPSPTDLTKPASQKDGYWSNYWAVPAVPTVPIGNFVSALRGQPSANYMPIGGTLTNTADTITLGASATTSTKTLEAYQSGLAGRPSVRFNGASKLWEATNTGAASSFFPLGSGLSQVARGLMLGTHPFQTAGAGGYQDNVLLYAADEIVMNDGVRTTGWGGQQAYIGSVGAGGLDTGSEQATEWYSIWAIRKSSDGTKNLLLHREKSWAAGSTYSYANRDIAALFRDSAARSILAQGVKFTPTGYVDFVDFPVSKTGTPTGVIWVELCSDAAGVPGAVLATSDKLDVSNLATTETNIRFLFRTPYLISSSSTQYWLVIQSTAALNVSNYLNIGCDGSTPTYANGSYALHNGSTWSAQSTYDLCHTAYVRQNDTALTLPSGYDQYAKLGYVLNNSGAFEQFYQIGDVVSFRRGNITYTSGNAYGTLTSIPHFPPVPVMGNFALAGDSAGALVWVSPVIVGPATSLAGGADARYNPYTTAGPQLEMTDMLVESQAVYLAKGAGTTATAFVRGYVLP